MNYINKSTGQYPITELAIRTANPNTSFPVPFVAPDEYALVFPTPQPVYDPITQAVREVAPALSAKGHYEQQWEVLELSPEQAAANAEAARIASIPDAVTMRQARLALLGAGLLDDIDAAINALPSPQKEAARIEWEYSQEVQRHNGFVSVLAPMLGLSELDIDELFIQAKTL